MQWNAQSSHLSDMYENGISSFCARYTQSHRNFTHIHLLGCVFFKHNVVHSCAMSYTKANSNTFPRPRFAYLGINAADPPNQIWFLSFACEKPIDHHFNIHTDRPWSVYGYLEFQPTHIRFEFARIFIFSEANEEKKIWILTRERERKKMSRKNIDFQLVQKERWQSLKLHDETDSHSHKMACH